MCGCGVGLQVKAVAYFLQTAHMGELLPHCLRSEILTGCLGIWGPRPPPPPPPCVLLVPTLRFGPCDVF